ncbi:MAG: rod shape-determining protein MreD [Emcibacteraceae bacterium]|jgi:rod shape-determining protein MreD|uniref:rod shape-determining protein MreD n=1 Tax=Pseudemcibacter sp. TaxID=2943293 RepID=UPI003F6A0E85|nr:rod shape-determining protein MreD [Kordiimonadaceae bacterium]MDC1090734.1 rod shape-determining protein MreD [Emcibacteraceae bacterium]MDG1021625.1 rod shape-determining protein MreD [Emcibacteraceae bacterium]MDG1726239.1 rod shape-determining protein MreD [Emcibacteraceae bacterium]
MNISPNKEASIGFNAVIPFLTILMLIFLMVLPYNIPLISDIMPFLTLIGVYYWSVFKPEYLPIWVVFILGGLQDILMGSPLGLMPLLLIVVQQFIFFQGRQFLERDFIFNWFVFVMLVIGFGIMSWGISSLYFRALLDYWDVLGQILMTIAFYPVITWLLGLTRKFVK